MKNIIVVIGILLVIAIGLTYIRQPGESESDVSNQDELVIYSGRKEPLILPIISNFEEKHNVNVTLKSGGSSELTNLLLEEGEESPADIIITTDASLLEKLAGENILSAITTEKTEAVPTEYQSEKNLWTGVSGRARVLIANTDLVSEEEYPTSVYDITDDQWRVNAAMASFTNESVVTHLSAMRVLHGDDFTSDFLQGVSENNVRILKGHTDVRKAVARGEYAIGLVNHYYGHLQQEETDNIAIIYPDQEEGEDGAFVNVSGVGIVSSGENQETAQQFVDFLLGEEAQKQFAELNFEFPLIDTVTASNTKPLSEFKHMDISLHQTAQELEDTLSLLNSLGL